MSRAFFPRFLKTFFYSIYVLCLTIKTRSKNKKVSILSAVFFLNFQYCFHIIPLLGHWYCCKRGNFDDMKILTLLTILFFSAKIPLVSLRIKYYIRNTNDLKYFTVKCHNLFSNNDMIFRYNNYTDFLQKAKTMNI